MTQKQAVLEHLQKHGSITSLEAINLYGATRLSSIIYKLKHKEGHDIASQREYVKNRYKHTSPIVRYILRKECE